ncbi:MAG: NAD-dependent deacylase [Verrucomicrobiota bacterium]
MSGGTIVVLTGAGISAESGIQTFRGGGGLWEGHAVEEVATPEGFAANPGLVQRFYNERRAALLDGIVPNEGHRALARLAREWRGEVVLVTQNIDDLHERAGSPEVIHMHGELLKARCLVCGDVQECREDLGAGSICEGCGAEGRLRPHVVWFGEMPLFLERIEGALLRAEKFLSVGTSGRVYPAAGFVQMARYAGAKTVEVNLEASEQSGVFQECRTGQAGDLVPELVSEWLSEG